MTITTTKSTITEHEVAQVERANASGATPVVFVHGLWLLPSSWDRWVTLFEEAGYVGVTPGWPDDPETVSEAREHPEALAGKGIRELADYEEGIIRRLNRKPVIMNGYADDLAAVIEELDLKDVTLVGHSTGGGEVARYIGRHGTKRVAAAVLIAAVPPILVKSDSNPEGIPIQVFDDLRRGLFNDRSQFYKDFAVMFYGANRPGAKVSQGLLDQFWLWSMLYFPEDTSESASCRIFHCDSRKNETAIPPRFFHKHPFLG